VEAKVAVIQFPSRADLELSDVDDDDDVVAADDDDDDNNDNDANDGVDGNGGVAAVDAALGLRAAGVIVPAGIGGDAPGGTGAGAGVVPASKRRLFPFGTEWMRAEFIINWNTHTAACDAPHLGIGVQATACHW
jgi:hypothetical protein